MLEINDPAYLPRKNMDMRSTRPETVNRKGPISTCSKHVQMVALSPQGSIWLGKPDCREPTGVERPFKMNVSKVGPADDVRKIEFATCALCDEAAS